MTGKNRYNDARDKNEAELIRLAVYTGAVVRKLPRGYGADLTVWYRGLTYTVEVKDPRQNWKFTESELKLRDEIERQGCVYYVWVEAGDVLRMLGR